MNPKNFPGRKNKRRIRALERLYDYLDNLRGISKFTKLEELKKDYIKEQIDILESRIISPGAARAIRTKKDRRLRGR